jgi:hypothetical protein
LHDKDEKVFLFEKFVTKLKESFHVLLKDKNKELTFKQIVNKLLQGIHSTDTSIASARSMSIKITVQTLTGQWSFCLA